jgi:hypothetical protein
VQPSFLDSGSDPLVAEMDDCSASVGGNVLEAPVIIAQDLAACSAGRPGDREHRRAGHEGGSIWGRPPSLDMVPT